MAADILAREAERAVGRGEGGGVEGAGALIARLARVERIEGTEQGIVAGLGDGGDAWQRAQRLLQILYAAQATGGFGDAVADAREDAVMAIGDQADAQQQALGRFVNVDVDDVGGTIDQPFGQGEAGGEIVEIGRGRHQHGIADAIIFERDRAFDRDRAGDGRAAAVRGDPGEADGPVGVAHRAARTVTGIDL